MPIKFYFTHKPPYYCNSLNEFFEFDSDHKEAALQLRQVIKTVSPGVVESIKWGVPFYQVGKGKNICFLTYKKLDKKDNTDSPLLGFYSGHLMYDNFKLLLNTGHAQVRYILVDHLDSAKQKLIEDYLKQALEVAQSPANRDDIHR